MNVFMSVYRDAIGLVEGTGSTQAVSFIGIRSLLSVSMFTYIDKVLSCVMTTITVYVDCTGP